MSEIKLTADSGGGTTSLKAPSSTTSNADVVLKLPVADGSANQVLKTDGSGQLSFGSDISDLVNDTSPQLGAQLDTNGNDISHGDASKSKYGASNDLQIHHTSDHSTIENATGELRIKNTSGSDMVLNSTGRIQLQVANGEKAVYCDNNGGVELYHDNNKKFETTASGLKVTAAN